MAVAPEKIEKVYYLLTTILGSMTPTEQEGFLNRYGDPLFPTPPDEAKLDAFISRFGTMIVGKTPDEITKEINSRELRSMVDTYEREAGKVTEVGRVAERRGKATVQELMQRALEAPVPTEEKGRLLEILEEKSQRQTDKTLPELTREAIEVVAVKQASTPVPDAFKAEVFRFSNLKDLEPLQRMLAPLADAVTTVFPEFRAGVINVVLAESLDKAVKNIDKLTKLFGTNVVNDPWFKKLRDDAQTLVAQGAKPGGAQSVVDDVFVSLFRGASEPSVTAYIELYRINYIQGKPTPSINQMHAAGLGWGSALRMGANVGVGTAKNAGAKWLAAKAGLALIPGPGWAASLIAMGGGFLGKAAGWLKRLVGLKAGGMVPGDKEIITVGCGSILVIFFLLPFMNQLIIDSALVGRLNMGGTTASPEGGGTVVGPIVQTAPISGPLACFNTTTSNPLSAGQVGVISSTLQSSDAKSIGLYNCILGCPQNQIDLHAGGASGWYGWATPGDITFYDGLFAASNHDRARNIAHELAHQWSYSNPNATDQFQQEGYCGKLCTYPSGRLGACSNLETIDETFAESAAMYLVGENLQSLCPRGYDFMKKMFSTCGGKQ